MFWMILKKSLEFDEENKRYKVKLTFNAEYDFSIRQFQIGQKQTALMKIWYALMTILLIFEKQNNRRG